MKFVGSSFIIGLAVTNDDQNKKAIKIRDAGLLDDDCYVSNLIINEVVTVIGNKTDENIATAAYNYLNDNYTVINEFEIPGIQDKIMDTYYKHSTKLSYTDCSIIEVMKAYNIKDLISFDHYFDKEKWLNRIF